MQINLDKTCYYSLPRIKSIDLLNPISQRALQKVSNPVIRQPLINKKKKNYKLKNQVSIEKNHLENQISNPLLIQQSQITDVPIENKFPKLKIKIIPARENNNSKLSFEKFTYRDPNTPRRMENYQKKKNSESQLQQHKSYLINNNKSPINFQQQLQVEQLKNVQSSIIYYLSQQTNLLDHHFDILENQLSF